MTNHKNLIDLQVDDELFGDSKDPFIHNEYVNKHCCIMTSFILTCPL